MKRTIITCAVACLALLAPVVSNASTKDYSGQIEPSGTISFQLEKKRGNEKVVELAWKNLPVDCKGKSRTTDGNLSFKILVEKNSFSARADLGPSKDPEASAKVRGTFKGKNANAKGTIEVSGSDLPTNDGKSGKCDSGKLDWSARS